MFKRYFIAFIKLLILRRFETTTQVCKYNMSSRLYFSGKGTWKWRKSVNLYFLDKVGPFFHNSSILSSNFQSQCFLTRCVLKSPISALHISDRYAMGKMSWNIPGRYSRPVSRKIPRALLGIPMSLVHL